MYVCTILNRDPDDGLSFLADALRKTTEVFARSAKTADDV